MAFDLNYFARVSSSGNNKAVNTYSYLSSADSAATIKGSGYFNSIADRLKIGDLIFIYSSDGISQTIKVTAVSPDVTTASQDGSLVGSHVIMFAGRHTTVGGGTIETFTVTGALTTDEVFAIVHTVGAVPRTVTRARVGATNTIAVEFSGDPSTDHVISYAILRQQS